MFPFDWGWGVWVDAALTMLLFAIAWRGRDRERDGVHRPILIMTWTIVAMVVVGIVGAGLHPIMLVVMGQPPRSFQFMKYFAFVYVAHDVLRRMGGGPASVLVAAAMAAALVDHSNRHVIPYVVVAAGGRVDGGMAPLAGAATWWARRSPRDDVHRLRHRVRVLPGG